MNLEPLRQRLEQLRTLLESLTEEEHPLYLVGGCVRDTLLGRETADLDFIVEGSGIERARLLSESTGGAFVPLKFDEGRVVLEKRWIVDFAGLGVGGIEANLRRRDFTVNAMAIELSNLLAQRWVMIDPTGGLPDLDSKTIRMTNPRSFAQDPLRILRAFRFSVQLDFEIEPKTLRAIEACSRSLESVAAERIASELMLLLHTDGSWRSIEQMANSGVLEVIFPELAEMNELPAHIRLVDHSIGSLKKLEHILEGGGGAVFESMEPWLEEYFESGRTKPLLKLAVLLHDVGKPRTFTSCEDGSVHFYGHDALGEELVRGVLKERLRMSKRDVTTVASLVRHHMRPHLLAGEPGTTARAMRRFFRDLGEEWPGVLLLAFADALATDNGDTVRLQSFVTQVVGFKLEEEKKGSLERLVTGDDLIEELGLSPGPLFKEILDRVAEEQAEGKIRTRDEALGFIREMLRGGKETR